MIPTSGVTLLIVVKNSIRRFLMWAGKHWRVLLLVAFLIFIEVKVLQHAYDSGFRAADEAWKTAYTNMVDDANKQNDKNLDDSESAADKSKENTKTIDKKIDSAVDSVNKAADKERESMNKRQTTPGAASLTSEMPASFTEAWNKINDAGAKELKE